MENLELFESIYEYTRQLIIRYGSLGIAAAMFAESAGVPFASSIVFLTSGSMILRGTCSFWLALLSSTIGITLGSIFSYSLGLLGSMVGNAVRFQLNHGNIAFFKNHNDSDRAARRGRSKLLGLWDRYGNYSIFMGQLWGFSRTFISFPAGAMHMNFYIFTLYTFLGGAIFSALIIGASIVMTGTMSIVVKILKTMFDFSPWLLLIPAALAATVIYLFRYRGWKLNCSWLTRLWDRLICSFRNIGGGDRT